MLLIGEDEAANIMANLNPEEVKSLGTSMYEVQDIDPGNSKYGIR